jgi:hypothetical protein
VTLVGREQIRTVIAESVGAGTATHHLFSYEIDLKSLTDAHGIWAMEDWVDRSDDDSVAEIAGAFRTLHGMAIITSSTRRWMESGLFHTRHSVGRSSRSHTEGPSSCREMT